MLKAICYPDRIPQEMQAAGNFWNLFTKIPSIDTVGNEIIDKAPICTDTFYHASVNKKENWTSFDKATKVAAKAGYEYWGLGICLGFDDILRAGFVCIDIDHCVVIEGNTIRIVGNKEITADAVNEIIIKFSTYTEVSPSGTGIHIFAPCKTCSRAVKKSGLEIYFTKRFIRVSGMYISADFAEMRKEDASEDVKWLVEKVTADTQNSSVKSDPVEASLFEGNYSCLIENLSPGTQNSSLKSNSNKDIYNPINDAQTRLIQWLNNNKIQFATLEGMNDFPVRLSVLCPWKEEHTQISQSNDSMILINQQGVYCYKCFHSHCSDKKWPDYVRFYDKSISFDLKRNLEKIKIWLLDNNHTILQAFGSVNPIDDYTDKGQAQIFAMLYSKIAVYVITTGEWVVYANGKWNFSLTKDSVWVARLSQQLTDIQLIEASTRKEKILTTLKVLRKSEAPQPEIDKAKKELVVIQKFYDYVKKRRSKFALTATVDVAKATLACDIALFDNNPYLLNTPGGVVDLKENNILENDPKLMLSKITAKAILNCIPSNQKNMWNDFLDKITNNNQELKAYLQLIFGSATFGKVMGEYLYIAYGRGGNGKSTLCNAVSSILGDYAGRLDAEYFNVDNRHNQLPQLAELRGKRLIIASETSDCSVMDSAAVKRLVSTDTIHAEAKFKAPFDFVPTHTVILCTNKIPTIKGVDDGIWDRLILIPFETKIRNTADEVKNYSDILKDECGEEILAWCIEGARNFLQLNGKIPIPKIVQDAIKKLRLDNSTADCFFEECSYPKNGSYISAHDLYQAYKNFCCNKENYISQHDFKVVAARYGYHQKKTSKCNVFTNIALKE